MNKYLPFACALPFLLAACNSDTTPVTPSDPVITMPAGPIAATSFDATIDLSTGINSAFYPNWKPNGDTFYLIKQRSVTPSNLLAQTTIGSDGHVRFTLPTATAIAPYLDSATPMQPADTGGCTSNAFSVKPASFKALSAGFVLKPNSGTIQYLNVVARTADDSVRTSLEYYDQDVTVDIKETCTGSGRTDIVVLQGVYLKGWNVSNETTVVTGTPTNPVYTHTTKINNSASGVAGLTLIGDTQAAAPAP